MTFIADGTLPVYQNFSGTAVEDAVYEGLHSGVITFTIETTDPFYEVWTIDDLFLNIIDNTEIAGVNVAFPNTDYFVEGSMDIPGELSLFSIPDEEVIVYATPDAQLDLGGGAGNMIYFTFEPNDTALIPQQINISVVDDILVEGDHIGTITFTSESYDILYQDITIADIIVNITDNDNTVAIEESTEIFPVIYPTINNGIFTVETGPLSVGAIISVINMTGQIVFAQTAQQTNSIDISSFASGKYFVLLNNNDKMYTNPIEIVK